jgi:hypothetical protein
MHQQGSQHPLRLPTGDLLPQITVQSLQGTNILWSVDLRKVADDLESRYLAAKGDELEFTIEVPGKGHVDGVLWYVASASRTFTSDCTDLGHLVAFGRLLFCSSFQCLMEQGAFFARE